MLSAGIYYHSFLSFADSTDFNQETKDLRFNTTHACVDIEIYDDKIVEKDNGFVHERFLNVPIPLQMSISIAHVRRKIFTSLMMIVCLFLVASY